MSTLRSKLRAALCLTALTVSLPECNQRAAPCNATLVASQISSEAAKQENSRASDAVLPAPFGRYTDDLDGMVKRQNIRALVTINPIGFFYDKGKPMGLNYEALRDFEVFVNEKLKSGALKLSVTFIPLRPDQLEAALLQGVGDVIAVALIVTPEREQLASFTVPIAKDVEQIVVTGPTLGKITSLEDLGGRRVYVNPLTANFQSLQKLNDKLKKAGKPPIDIRAADENLMDDDLLQMVNAGLMPATVTLAWRANLWSQLLPHLVAHPDLVIASGERMAWALRKNNPQLKQIMDEYIAPRALGSNFGNTLLRRYLENTKWVKDATSAEEIRKFTTLSAIFKKYAGEYDFDYLMIMAQGYQESMLDQNKRSPSGAVGIMQVIPTYAAAPPIDIPNVEAADGNIHAGVKILRHIEDQYFNDPKIDSVDKTLMAFASYNAGPTRIAKLREQAGQQGLDPNKWFGNVELMVAKEIGQGTVTYVANVYKYNIAYKLAEEESKPLENVQPGMQSRASH